MILMIDNYDSFTYNRGGGGGSRRMTCSWA